MSPKVYSRSSWCFPQPKYINEKKDDVKIPTDELLREIFAPDPLTGNPTSDLSLLVHGENLELNEYIRSHLMNPVGSKALLGSSDEDGEAALDALPRLDDGENEYYERLVQLASVTNQEVKE